MPTNLPQDNPESLLAELLKSLIYAVIIVGFAAILVWLPILGFYLRRFA